MKHVSRITHHVEKATHRAGVAGGSCRMDFYQQGVAVAIVKYLDHFLGVAAGSAFVPQFLPRAAPEPSFAGFQCQPQRFGVHPRQRQHLQRVSILHNCRNQPGIIPFEIGEFWVQVQSFWFLVQCSKFKVSSFIQSLTGSLSHLLTFTFHSSRFTNHQ